MIYIDKECRWFYNGAEMVNRQIILEFYRNMTRDSLGNYVISLNDEHCTVEVEDAPFIINRITAEQKEGTGFSRIVLYVNDDTREDLCPETLFVGDGNVMYCKIKPGRFTARFSRAAYYQLVEYIQQDGEGYCFYLNNTAYKIKHY